jgi:hypothetical protein
MAAAGTANPDTAIGNPGIIEFESGSAFFTLNNHRAITRGSKFGLRIKDQGLRSRIEDRGSGFRVQGSGIAG